MVDFSSEDINRMGDNLKKALDVLPKDLMGNIEKLTAAAREIEEGKNPVESEFDFMIGKHQIKGQVRKNGNITLLSQSNGVVEEIKKRLHNDRPT